MWYWTLEDIDETTGLVTERDTDKIRETKQIVWNMTNSKIQLI